MKVNFRIGVKISQLFPNVAIFVFAVEPKLGDKIIQRMNEIRGLMVLAGHGEIADKIVCEFRN
jgi:hypothetical protein